ncbi:MAG: tRNA (adenosine(37)-N6)-threonylcarbamoyltransferase complex dimerization subunit type 1 TsaB [Xanthomonadaceae bacterium]|nr:tRNA (adenosine(37)-N6)-threonylcarbamoyltransferase complex dimerization subunit type 1 TsaB [Xanthomonadaceae bacterium]
MKILALETATEALSVALLVDGTLHAHHEVAPRRHGELLLGAVDALLIQSKLKLADLDALAFGRGPGAFTGVRIAVSAAQGLAFGAGLQVVPISTLAALAQAALDAGAPRVVAAIDARMGEVYAAAFTADSEGLAVTAGDEFLGPAAAFTAPAGTWFGAGTGFGAYPDAFTLEMDGTDPDALPTAAAVARLAAREVAHGRTVAPEQAMPVYLRDTVTNL